MRSRIPPIIISPRSSRHSAHVVWMMFWMISAKYGSMHLSFTALASVWSRIFRPALDLIGASMNSSWNMFEKNVSGAIAFGPNIPNWICMALILKAAPVIPTGEGSVK